MDNNKPPEAAKPVAPVNFIDDPHAPEWYADEAFGLFLNNGVVKITLSSNRVNHETSPGPVNRVVVGRLTMPLQTAQTLATTLFSFLKQNGVDPSGGQTPH